MKRLLAGLGLSIALAIVSAYGQGADDQYVHIYTLIQQGDALDAASQPAQALAKYQEAQSDLEKFQRVNPDWNNTIINFRLAYLAAHIAEIQSQLPPPAETTTTNVTSTNAVTSPAPATSSQTSELESQLHALQDQVQKLEADKQMTEAKLKEALSAQPASIDPRELEKAQEKVTQLQKENDLLKVSLEQAQSKAAQVADTKAAEEATQKLAEANRQLAEQTEKAGKLAAANEALQARLQSLVNSPQAVAALQAENELLKKQVAQLQATAPAAGGAADVNRQLADARTQIAELQSENQTLHLETTALQDRVKKLSGSSTAASTDVLPPATENSARIKELEQERDDLQKKLALAGKELSARNTGKAATRVEVLTSQLNQLRANLAIYEARAVPYTAEELALFKAPATIPVAINPKADQKSIQAALPPNTGTLVAEAQRHFAAKQFDKAEDDYQQILKHDDKNTYALANLAAIELEMNHLDDAQKHITQAVEQAPNDAYNLSILGYLRLKQGKYDEALDVLSRAAKLDPQNAEIQNYLGVVLGHKGLRSQAETALRKAIQLNPNYGSAHNNLAVIYITQKPPLVELARWHYQKALAAGQPKNPELEKLLEENRSADTNQ